MRDMSKINITKDVGAHIMLSAFKEDTINRKYLVDLLFKSLDEHSITTFLQIMTDKEKPTLPRVGDVIIFTEEKYDKITCDNDILKDHDVYCDEVYTLDPSRNTFYGIITDDSGYNDTFNPWHYKFKVSVITNDSEGDLTLVKKEVRWEELNILTTDTVIRSKCKQVYETLSKKSPELPF